MQARFVESHVEPTKKLFFPSKNNYHSEEKKIKLVTVSELINWWTMQKSWVEAKKLTQFILGLKLRFIEHPLLCKK